MRFNLKEYNELENVLTSFLSQFFHVSHCFRKEFGQIYIIIQILSWLDEKRPNTLKLQIHYAMPSLCYNCCFANRTIFVIKRPFAT